MTICKRCIMDDSDPDIVFDENGFCNHCTEYYQRAKIVLKQNENLPKIMEQIKRHGRDKKYDGAIGISGGADSTYTSYIAHKYDLNLLTIHFDNGYDAPEGKHNVNAVVENTGWDYKYKTMDLDEFEDLQVAYLKSGVLNFEAISDHAIRAIVFRTIRKYDIKYLFGGQNLVTEGIMPKAWTYTFADITNIKNIHRKFGTMPLQTYPMLGALEWAFIVFTKNIRKVTPLNWVDYNVAEVKKLLTKEWGWKDYGHKHGENIITRFFQHYILPRRFGYNKELPHLSTLICSGQMTRAEALKRYWDCTEYSTERFEKDHAFVLNKLGLSKEEFEELMNLPRVKHEVYGTYGWKQDLMNLGYYVGKKMKRYSI